MGEIAISVGVRVVKRKRRKKPVRKRMRKSKPVSIYQLNKRTVQNIVTMVTMSARGQALKKRTIVSLGGMLAYKLGTAGCLLSKEKDAVTQ